MNRTRFVLPLLACCGLSAAFSQTAAAWTLCVNPAGSNGCYSKIQDAVRTSDSSRLASINAFIF